LEEVLARVKTIRSGGQTGADRGALDAARSLHVPITGWCPLGGLAEDYPDPPGLLLVYPELVETPSRDYYERTEWNVRDSDATLILLPREVINSPGTNYTIDIARKLRRPYLVIHDFEADPVIAWLDNLGDDLELNVAGPRERFYPGMHDMTFSLITELLEHYSPKPSCMNVVIINEKKKGFLDLLLLADEQEDMIDTYLDRGVLFALYDDDLKGICVVTDEGNGTFEIQNLAVYPQYQNKGYGRYLIDYVCDYHKENGTTMIVGTGDTPVIVPFYENSGFVFSHRIENYILEHYNEPIFEHGVQLKDKVYFKRGL